MISFRCIRRLPTTLTLLVALVALPGCMLIPHHSHNGETRTEQAFSAHAHSGHGAEASEPTTAEVAAADKINHGHEGMTMMHGSGRWEWFVGGAMVVMMALMVL